MRPSCGLRRSAMSSFASTLKRVMTPAAVDRGIRCVSRRIPSTRKRTKSESSCGSKWMSERSVLRRLEEDRVDEAHERLVGQAVVGLEVGLGQEVLLELELRALEDGRNGGGGGRASHAADLLEDLVAAWRPRARAGAASRAAARRSPARLAGSATAIRRTSPSSSYGIATTRSSTRIGTVTAAVSSMDVVEKSTSGSPNCCGAMARDRRRSTRSPRRRGRARGSPSGARGSPASASLSAGTSLVAPIRSTSRSIDSEPPNGAAADAVRLGGSRRPQAREACLMIRHGRLASRFDPSNEASAFRARSVSPNG